MRPVKSSSGKLKAESGAGRGTAEGERQWLPQGPAKIGAEFGMGYRLNYLTLPYAPWTIEADIVARCRCQPSWRGLGPLFALSSPPVTSRVHNSYSHGQN